MSFNIDHHRIGGAKVFVIAEIGQNHQGDIEIAKRLIAEAKLAGVDCVKFQKSHLNEKFTKNALNRIYDGPNSWGRTYGEHKQCLEFSMEQYKLLQTFAKQQNVLFTASAMDIESLKQLNDLNVPVIKIGSGDANNIPLLTAAAQLKAPLIISTGMQNETMVHRIVDIMAVNQKTNYCLMHCVSAYPTAPCDVNLRLLHLYRNSFAGICLGYSGHEEGTAISTAAVVFGAKVIERHFTLDKHQKGTDHKLSLEPAELRQLITRIRLVEGKLNTLDDNENVEKVLHFLSPIVADCELNAIKMAIAPVQRKQIQPCEMACRLKLGKSLVYRTHLKCGQKLCEDDICAKVSEPFGISAEHFDRFIGMILTKNVNKDENLDECHFGT